LSQPFTGIIKSQVILEAKDFMNEYINDIIIEIYVNVLIASIAIIAKRTNWKVEVTDYYQSGKFDPYHLKNAQWT
jgi:hypothetical protein